MVEFMNLVSYFKATQERFEKAKTHEERRDLLAVSNEITREARELVKLRKRAPAWRQPPERHNQPMRSNIQVPPKISFDLGGVVKVNKSFAPGGTIFSEGDVAETLMYIQTGRVKLSVATKTGKEAIVAILGPGEFLGEACLGRRDTRTGTATAIVSTALQVIEKNEMVRGLRADHRLSYAFLSYLLSRNIRLEEDLVDQVSHSSEKRLARALLLLAGKRGKRKPHMFAGISQETLATMIGTTRARVNFFMNKFRKNGFIKYRGPLDAHGGMHINTARLAKVLR
ncbi:MAG: Crp/Fnr family transcriptional regulator [Candidatus Acidiferrum sp.]|jgi:CRP/FNR family cyclic AMP-dependent transcriptional regulator